MWRPCPSFPCFLGKWQGKPPKKQGFFIPAEPLKTLEKKGKTLKKTRNSLQGKKARKSKKARKGRIGESLGGSQAPPSFWEVHRLPRKFPELPRKFFGDFPGSSLTVEFNSNPEVPRKFPKLPRKFPKLPRKFPDFPGGQPLSLGSPTPSPDSQKLSPGEIQKGTGGRGRDRKCHKLS